MAVQGKCSDCGNHAALEPAPDGALICDRCALERERDAADAGDATYQDPAEVPSSLESPERRRVADRLFDGERVPGKMGWRDV